jgi:isoleucyl-tRNA synthetase
VHLSEWPKAGHINEEVLSGMMFVRAFASNALMQRTQAGIRVRQVLQSFTIKHNGPEIPFWKDLTEILKEEINVREIILDSTPKQEDGPGMFLDLNITPELKQEGEFRELVRGIQDIRKVMGLVPSDIVSLSLDTDKRGQDLALQFEKELTKVVGAKNILFVENDGTEVKVDELKFKIKLYK